MRTGRKNPAVPVTEVPIDLVTNSGSGLDPDISPKAASVQVNRISKLTNIPKEKLNQLIKDRNRRSCAWFIWRDPRKRLKAKFGITEINEIVTVLPQSNGLR